MPVLPNLPTDNLYKLVFVGGLALIFASGSLMTDKIEHLRNNLAAIKIDIVKAKEIIRNAENDSKETDKQIEHLMEKLKVVQPDTTPALNAIKMIYKNLHDKEYRDYFAFVSSHENEINTYYKMLDELKQKNKEEKNKYKERVLAKQPLKCADQATSRRIKRPLRDADI